MTGSYQRIDEAAVAAANERGVLRMRRILFIALALVPWGAAQAGFKVIEPPAPAKPAATLPAPATTPPASETPAAVKPAVASATPAKAGFQPLDGGSPDEAFTPQSGAFGSSAVTYTGIPPEDIEIRRGLGKDVRLADALKQIAPEGWRGFGRPEIADSFNPDKTISWAGGKPWPAVLDQVARNEGLAVEIDWNRRHLYVGKRTPAPTQLAQAEPAAAATPIAAPPPAAPVVAQPVWDAKVGSTVRATLEEWAKRAGWMLVWPMGDLDYRIVAPLRFDGSIVDATSKLARLYETAERPLAVDIHTNQKVIAFSEKGVVAP